MSALGKLIIETYKTHLRDHATPLIRDCQNPLCKFVAEAKEELAAKDAAIAAARALYDKMQVVYQESEYSSIWGLAHSHFGEYKGPNWIAEQDALAAALKVLEK